ncbi:MAG: AMP-binding protein, partial [Thaumarchaeota archaeon]|nr:AMP-binding protein [Nitrososphaerota archaeon]
MRRCAMMRIPFEGTWVNNWLERRSALTPEWVAIADDATGTERRLTFRELNERANKVAAYLKEEAGVKKGEFVCALTWPRVEVIDLLFACSKLGAVFVPFNTRYTETEISRLIRQYRPKATVMEEEFAGRMQDLSMRLPSLLRLSSTSNASGEYTKAAEYSAGLNQTEQVDLEDPVMILQTGGTTGWPKSAIINHRMLLWNAVNTMRDLIVPYDVTITAVPLFHIGGYTYTIPLLFWGGSNILMHRWDVDRFLDIVDRERPTFLFLVPAQLGSLIQSERFKHADFSSVRFITAGGAALTSEMARATFERGVTQKQGFGMTEMGPGVFALDPSDAFANMGSIGKPNLLIESKIVREDERLSATNEPGELWLRGPSVFGGYWNDEKETTERFENGWLKTGDVVKEDAHGFFYVVGRTKNVIRSGSESIFPEEVERVLQAHPSVQEALVIGVPDPKWGETPKALVVLK